MLRSSSKSASARVRASSVLPTPVGPKKIKLPTGRLGSLIPLRALSTASATALTASSCPITRSCRISSSRISFSRSPSSSRLTGTPVQRLTTLAISDSLTSSLSSMLFFCLPARCSSSDCRRLSRSFSFPYFNSAARFRSYSRSAFSISLRISSMSRLIDRTLEIDCFSVCHWAVIALASVCSSASSICSFSRRSREA